MNVGMIVYIIGWTIIALATLSLGWGQFSLVFLGGMLVYLSGMISGINIAGGKDG